MAAERGHMDIVRYLVRQGADINIKDKNGVIIASHVCDYVHYILTVDIYTVEPSR